MLTKRLNQSVKLLFILLNLSWVNISVAQVLTLDQCVQQAQEYSFNQDKIKLLKNIEELQNENFTRDYFPQIQIKGSAAYQSDVFGLPVNLPGNELPEIPKDQYNLSLNVSQNIYDGGISSANKSISLADFEFKKSQVDVASFKIREIVSDIYFGILLIKENQELLYAALEEIKNQENRVKASFEEGILLKSDLQKLQIERIKIEDQISSAFSTEESLRNSLSLWTGTEVPKDIELDLPESPITDETVQRPELNVFSAQQNTLSAQQHLIQAVTLPKVVAFANAGYANPNPLNFFEPDWSDYYMIGARLEWPVWSWNKSQRKKDILEAQKSIIDTDREDYLMQIESQRLKLVSSITSLENTLLTDEKIYQMQKEILDEHKIRFEAGTLSSSEYLSALNDYTQLGQKMVLHKLQMIKNKIDYNILMGN